MARNDPFGLRNIDLGFGPKKTNRKTITKSLRNQVWLKYMRNNAEGKCYCCRMRTIHFTDFQVGHNKAVARGGKDNISNLRPICGPCNRGMGTKSIEWYRKKYFAKPDKSRKKTKRITKRKRSRPRDPLYISLPKIKLGI